MAKIFEGCMLVCFGTAWPMSIAKMQKVKCSAGKSFIFLYTILIGYLCGICYKIFSGADVILSFYIFNTLMVSIDITLSHKYRKPRAVELVKR